MKKLIALRGSVAGTHSSKLYELIYLNDVIYVFITNSYNNSLTIEKIIEDGYHIGKNIFKDVILNPLQFQYHHYEDFVGIWRAVILLEHKFESNKYYNHLLQLMNEKDKASNKYEELYAKLRMFLNDIK